MSVRLEAAEMTKLLGMLYRDVNIALANELSAFCEVSWCRFRTDSASSQHRRRGKSALARYRRWWSLYSRISVFFDAGITETRHYSTHLEAAREINDLQPARQLERISRRMEVTKRTEGTYHGSRFSARSESGHFSPAFALKDELIQHRRTDHNRRPPLF